VRAQCVVNLDAVVVIEDVGRNDAADMPGKAALLSEFGIDGFPFVETH